MLIKDLFSNSDNVYIIAEVSQNHDGSLGQAHAFIDACAKTGVDAIKFQTHIAEAESTPDEPFRIKFSYEDKTRYDYWRRMEFTEEQWIELKEHAESCNLEFLSSAFSKEAFDMLERIGVPAWKLGSGEVFNSYLLEQMIATGKPILLSSGMSTYEDIENQIRKIEKNANPYVIFQCTTEYPNSYETVGLNVIEELQERYHCPIGLSDHSGTIFPALAAVAKGARVIETHVSMSKYMFGPDISSSLTIEQLTEMVEGVRAISCMLNHPVDKYKLADKYNNMKSIFAKGLYAKKDISEGEEISIEALSMKKPLKGISAEKYKEVLGKKVKRNISAGEAITTDDIDLF